MTQSKNGQRTKQTFLRSRQEGLLRSLLAFFCQGRKSSSGKEINMCKGPEASEHWHLAEGNTECCAHTTPTLHHPPPSPTCASIQLHPSTTWIPWPPSSLPLSHPHAIGPASGTEGFPDSSVGKESACNAGDPGLIPGSGRSAGEGIGYPLQYSWASFEAQLIKNLPVMREAWVRSLDWEDPLEKRGYSL